MFTGDRSGDFLVAAMHAAGFASIPTSQHSRDGLKLRGAYITAVLRCAPPENKPTTREMRHCQSYLEAEVASLSQIRVVVALGKIAFDAYWRLIAEHDVAPRPRPRFAHGYVFRADGVPALITSYHPSQQNTNTGKLTQPMLADVLSQAKDIADASSG
jgi:uracil-DNA glycosylase family 4